MARKFVMIGAALAAFGLAAPVAAQSVDDDVRCLLASNVFARVEKDAARRQIATAAQVFYLGRLDARISTAQLKTAMQAQAKTMQAATLGPVMDGCAKRLAAKGVAMQGFSVGPKAPAAPPAKK